MAYLALFDILGFKHAILTRQMDELLELLGDDLTEKLNVSSTFNRTGKKPEKGERFWQDHFALGEKEIDFIRFSDAILLYTGESEWELFHLLLACNRVIAQGARQRSC